MTFKYTFERYTTKRCF